METLIGCSPDKKMVMLQIVEGETYAFPVRDMPKLVESMRRATCEPWSEDWDSRVDRQNGEILLAQKAKVRRKGRKIEIERFQVLALTPGSALLLANALEEEHTRLTRSLN